ncbi:MAG TPA: purine-nucleoside phosphorylase [Gemmataceae bacterium]|nr:purine-nucleoside phosphorylase [Gemmataceae bacterium]
MILTFAELLDHCRAAPPAAAIVLGSGMAPVAARLHAPRAVPFAAVPSLPPPTVAGHGGRLLLGGWYGRRVLVFEGRLHRYEGHPWADVVRPVHVARDLGAPVLLLTNAAGGIHPALGPGSLMAITDHIDWTRPYCWREPSARPSPYSPRLRDLFHTAARAAGIELHQGVYAALTGPCYETPAEIRALRAWGAAAVGMSTAREAQAAAELGLECAAVSCITNRAAGLGDGPLSHEEVLATGQALAGRLADLLGGLLCLL